LLEYRDAQQFELSAEAFDALARQVEELVYESILDANGNETGEQNTDSIEYLANQWSLKWNTASSRADPVGPVNKLLNSLRAAEPPTGKNRIGATEQMVRTASVLSRKARSFRRSVNGGEVLKRS